METELTGIESLLKENQEFNNWCDKVGEDISKEKFINKSNISDIIKTHIMNNESSFYESICNELERKIDTVKKKVHKSLGESHKKYVENGFILSALNQRLKKYNIERTKSYQRNSYFRLKKFLIENGYEDIFENFKITESES